MQRPDDTKLRVALSQLLEAERRFEQARAASQEAQRIYWHQQTERNAAVTAAAALLNQVGGVVTHDEHAFEFESRQRVRITRVARALPTEQTNLGLDAARG